MNGHLPKTLAVLWILGAVPAAQAQHLPSPGTTFDQLLLMTQEAASAGDLERTARLALLARSRILLRTEASAQEAILRIFDDLTTSASRRAKSYVAAVEKHGDPLLLLESVAAAWKERADPLAAQVDDLIQRKYRECARFALEPMWVLDPSRALEALTRIEAIPAAEVVEGDGPLNKALRMADAMSRGARGMGIARIETPDPNQKRIEELRRETALGMVDVARVALESGHAWVALDLAEIAPSIFALHGKRFDELRAAAWSALADSRAGDSKTLVTGRFKGAKRLLSNRAWVVTADGVRFPVPSGKPGALVTTVPQQGDFRFAAEFMGDFEREAPAMLVGFKNAGDYFTVSVSVADGLPGVRIRRHVEGKARDVYSWEAESADVLSEGGGVLPLQLERRGNDLWFRVGNAPWQSWSSRVTDLSGAIGFHVEGGSPGAARAEARNLEFETLSR